MLIRQLVTSGVPDDLASLQEVRPQLILVFGSASQLMAGHLVHALAEALPESVLMGCSAAGVITHQGVHEALSVVTAIHFASPRFKAVTEPLGAMDQCHAIGVQLGHKLAAPDLRAALVLAPGLHINGTHLLEGMQSVLGDAFPISGGLAGDDGHFKDTLTFLGTDITSDRVVALGFYGPGLQVRSASMGGWEPFGPIRKITRSEGNLLYSLDGEPALDVYRRYLGEWADALPASARLFPFALYRKDLSEVHVVRTILGVDESNGSLVLAGNAPREGFVRLMHASTAGLLEGARHAAESVHAKGLSEDRDRLALLFSCIGRKLMLGQRVEEEPEAVASVLGARTQLAGLYAYGEIGPLPMGTGCVLHNQTMTITLLEEA